MNEAAKKSDQFRKRIRRNEIDGKFSTIRKSLIAENIINMDI